MSYSLLHNHPHGHTHGAADSHDGALSLLRSIGETVRLWRSRIRERRDLAAWTDRDLHDIAMSRATLEYEMAKPFWRA
jgi:uncharacterized protein YjiS (DUF1127 family)